MEALFGLRRSTVTSNENSQRRAHFFVYTATTLCDLTFGEKRGFEAFNLGDVESFDAFY